LNPGLPQDQTALAARIVGVPIRSSWTNVLGRSSLDGPAQRRTATRTATWRQLLAMSFIPVAPSPAAQDSWRRSALLLPPLTVISVQEDAAIYAPMRAQLNLMGGRCLLRCVKHSQAWSWQVP